MTLANDEFFMRRACWICAKRGLGKVELKSHMVGAIIPLGWPICECRRRFFHRKFGGPHAEVLAR